MMIEFWLSIMLGLILFLVGVAAGRDWTGKAEYYENMYWSAQAHINELEGELK